MRSHQPEHRELAGVPEELMFATTPQLAHALLDRAHRLGIRAAFVAGDEVKDPPETANPEPECRFGVIPMSCDITRGGLHVWL
jgi:hypothetical protein